MPSRQVQSVDNSKISQDSEESQKYMSSLISDLIDQESLEFDPEEHAPITLSYIFGINRKLGARILNRTPSEHYCIYSLGHVASLINLNSKSVLHFQGHETMLVSIEHDRKGVYMETADQEGIIIWDLGDLGKETPVKLRIIYKPFGKNVNIAAACMSSCGKYIAVGSERSEHGAIIQFWRWSFGTNEPDGSFHISDKFGKIRSIKFSHNPNESEFFVVTLKYGVVFAWWNSESKRLEIHTPEQKKFGTLNQSCYVPGRRTVASTTSHGRIVIWGDDLIQDNGEPITNKKNFIKMLSVQNPYKIYDIKEIDCMLATCNENGEIRFYDSEIRLLYAFKMWKDTPILHIAPVQVPKKVKLLEADDFDFEEDDDVEIVYKSTCPIDCTLEKKPFLVREFYVVARTGDIVHCNIFKKEYKSMLYRTSDTLVSFDMLQHKPWVVCANSNAKIFYLDYENYSVVREQRLKEYRTDDDGREIIPAVTCIRISQDGNFLAIGYSNGAIWMIDPVIITALTPAPLRFSKQAITHMIFSSHPALAYSDANSTITLLRYNSEKMEWQLSGKFRNHNKPLILLSIAEIFAGRQSLIALGEDRLCVEYDLEKSIRKSSLEMKRDVVLEQSAEFAAAVMIKLSKIVEKDTSTNGQVILVADSMYKFKIFDIVTFERLYMFGAPIFDAPIRVLMCFSEPHKFYSNMLLFATEKTLGCVVLPIDGNMFRYAGITAHPKKINMLIPYGNDIFACAEGDLGGTVWNIDQPNVYKYHKAGGEGLVPFCKFIPGGKEGWMFKEMQDMFYYMQIMSRGGDAPEEHAVTDFIPIEDLPDYMRSIGFFPSDYGIKCLLQQATRTTSPSIPPPTSISFEDTVLLYLNHKPIAGYELDDIKVAVEYLADQHSSDYVTSDYVDTFDDIQITLHRILKLMTSRGEAVSEESAKRYLIELLSDDTGKLTMKNMNIDEEFNALPELFNVHEFCSDLLGIELKSKSQEGLESRLGNLIDPAELYNQLENRLKILVPESDIDFEKEYENDESKSLLKQGRIIKIVDDQAVP